MAKIFVITSGKGGVGKTTTAINLGAALNLFGEEVIIVDANLTTPNIGLHLGAPIVPVSLNHVLKNEAEVYEAIYEHYSGTKIMPSDLSIKELNTLDFSKMGEIVEKLKELSEYVILDSPAGLAEDSMNILDTADEIVIVTNPEIPAVTDALKTIKVAEGKGKYVKGIVLNRVKNQKTEMPLSNIREMLEYPIIGLIPEDKNMQKALILKDAILHTHPNSKASIAYKELVERLTGKTYQSPESAFRKLMRKLGF